MSSVVYFAVLCSVHSRPISAPDALSTWTRLDVSAKGVHECDQVLRVGDSLFGRQSLPAFGEHLSHQIDLGLLARQDGVGKRARPLMVAAIEHGFGHLQGALVVRDH